MKKEEAYIKLLEAMGEINLLRFIFKKEFKEINLLKDYENLLNILAIYETKIRHDADEINLTENL